MESVEKVVQRSVTIRCQPGFSLRDKAAYVTLLVAETEDGEVTRSANYLLTAEEALDLGIDLVLTGRSAEMSAGLTLFQMEMRERGDDSAAQMVDQFHDWVVAQIEEQK